MDIEKFKKDLEWLNREELVYLRSIIRSRMADEITERVRLLKKSGVKRSVLVYNIVMEEMNMKVHEAEDFVDDIN